MLTWLWRSRSISSRSARDVVCRSTSGGTTTGLTTSVTVPVPVPLKGLERIAIRTEAAPFYAYNWFDNQTEPLPTPTFSICGVVRDEEMDGGGEDRGFRQTPGHFPLLHRRRCIARGDRVGELLGGGLALSIGEDRRARRGDRPGRLQAPRARGRRKRRRPRRIAPRRTSA